MGPNFGGPPYGEGGHRSAQIVADEKHPADVAGGMSLDESRAALGGEDSNPQ